MTVLRSNWGTTRESSRLPHGRAGTYTNWNCRCDRCRAAWTAYFAVQKHQRAVRLRAGEVTVSHGLASTYNNWGCRCDRCREAHAALMRRYYASRKTA